VTLLGYRAMTGVLAVCVLFSMGDHYLHWGFLGDHAKLVAIIASGLIALLIGYMPEKVAREVEARLEAQRNAQLETEREWERTRDESNTEVDAEITRKAIGLPPATSSERTREE